MGILQSRRNQTTTCTSSKEGDRGGKREKTERERERKRAVPNALSLQRAVPNTLSHRTGELG